MSVSWIKEDEHPLVPFHAVGLSLQQSYWCGHDLMCQGGWMRCDGGIRPGEEASIWAPWALHSVHDAATGLEVRVQVPCNCYGCWTYPSLRAQSPGLASLWMSLPGCGTESLLLGSPAGLAQDVQEPGLTVEQEGCGRHGQWEGASVSWSDLMLGGIRSSPQSSCSHVSAGFQRFLFDMS